MPFFDSIYAFYALAALSAVLLAESVYLLLFSAASYRSRINRRLRLIKDQPDREATLAMLRRERGLTAGGAYRLPLQSLNRLVLQSGLTMGFGKLVVVNVVFGCMVVAAALVFGIDPAHAIPGAIILDLIFCPLALSLMRRRRHKKFGAQFPDALDIIVRSLRAGHPVPIAIAMVAREMPDPVGTEFGLASDEITYGTDLETAMRNLYFRVGQQDLPLFVTAVAIQASTGGRLSEILESLSGVIRTRFKLRRKVKALAAEGRFSAIFLSAVPLVLFLVLNMTAPEFYRSVWQVEFTKFGLAIAGCWMMVGNYIMYRLVNFKI
ncbi:MAG TPA: type II secretion system F family protein [Xanthobacteraceae bacterium]|nr:type II secretion system F family protein [Xanthobacteraceae bacterium]